MKVLFIEKNALRVIILSLLFCVLIIPMFSMEKIIPASAVKEDVPIYSVKRDDKKIAVTFDSAWGNEDLKEILKILDSYNCKSTFFIVGDFLDKYRDDVKLIHEKGHLVANHSDKHPHYNKLTEEKILSDILACNEKIKNITGVDNKFLRAPYGEYDDKVLKICRENGFYYIQWDVDSLDWKDLTPRQIYERVINKVESGSIILFHNGAKHTKEALPMVLEKLKNDGYEFVTIENLIYKDNYYTDSKGLQIIN